MCICVYMNRCVYLYMYVCMYVCVHVCMYACMHACMYVCMCVWMDGCMFVWMGGWMDGWMDVFRAAASSALPFATARDTLLGKNNCSKESLSQNVCIGACVVSIRTSIGRRVVKSETVSLVVVMVSSDVCVSLVSSVLNCIISLVPAV